MTTAHDKYQDFGAIHLTFPGWTPRDIGALTVKKRRYYAQWSLARWERMNTNA